MGELVHLRLDSKMRNAIRQLVKEEPYISETEFIRESIRDKLDYYRKVKILNSMRGTVKRSKNPTKMPRSELFRAVGLED